MDIVVEDEVVIGIKAVAALLPVHSSQLFTYLELSGKKVGLLINFNISVLRRGFKRVVSRYQGPTPASPLLRPSALQEEAC